MALSQKQHKQIRKDIMVKKAKKSAPKAIKKVSDATNKNKVKSEKTTSVVVENGVVVIEAVKDVEVEDKAVETNTTVVNDDGVVSVKSVSDAK